MSFSNKVFSARGVTGLVIFCVLLTVLIPSIASRLGYALPGKAGIPCRIFHKGRAYFGPQQCDKDFAYGTQLTFQSRSELVDEKKYQLTQVGQVFTVFGSPYPVFTDVKTGEAAPQMTPTRLLLLIENEGYIGYGLSGGP